MKPWGKKQAIWESEEYYQKAHEAGQTIHPGLLSIKEEAEKAQEILEVGCGEGSKLRLITPPDGHGMGVDISETAVNRAHTQYPQFQFQVADAERLPFASEQFDLVFSTFTLEHLQNTERVIQEMIRVTKPKGTLALLAPNYGAPNRASPCFHGSRLKKLLIGLGRDWFRLLYPRAELEWQPVTPKAEPGNYEIDWDTTIEPYLGSLSQFLKQEGVWLGKVSSFWGIELMLPWWQKPLAVLGKLKVYPFVYWGPHLLVIGHKQTTVKKSWARKIGMAAVLLMVFVLPLTVPLLLLGAGIWVARRLRANR
jgi:ubiquinone/menaquinone biosynthesis C-methylase UbiE